MKPAVFIHTNAKQMLGARVARHALLRNTAAADRFDLHIIETRSFDFITARHGQRYLRGGRHSTWSADDLQSFTPLRFAVPELMGYQGRAVIMDPDIFALRDIHDLLERDMQGAAIVARPIPARGKQPAMWASSVMLLDCARLAHWNVAQQFDELFQFRRDYRLWMNLLDEPAGSIGELPGQWNDFDHLDEDTCLLHTTQRRTQPWKSGLPIDFAEQDKSLRRRARQGMVSTLRRLRGDPAPLGRYQPHPDPAQERLFYKLLAECVDIGSISLAEIRSEIAAGNIRADSLECMKAAHAHRSPALSA